MKSPASVQQFFKTVLQQVCNFCVGVIAGDAKAAAYKYYNSQEYPDLHDSSSAVMPREMQREVNTGYPFEGKLHVDFSTKNHPPQLHAADDLDCCFMAVLSRRKPLGPRIMRKLWSNITTGQSANLSEQTDDEEETQTGRQFA